MSKSETTIEALKYQVREMYRAKLTSGANISDALWAVYQAGRRGMPGRSDVNDILDEVARKHGMTAEALRTRRDKTRAFARARWELWFELRDRLDMAFAEIERWHRFDHSTVISGVRAHERLLDELEAVRRAAKLAQGTAGSHGSGDTAPGSDPREAEGVALPVAGKGVVGDAPLASAAKSPSRRAA